MSLGLLNTIEFPNLFSGSIKIDRVAFNLFGLDVYWYGIIITFGLILAACYGLKKSKSVGYISDTVFDVVFWGIIGGFVGARAYYCIFCNLNPESPLKYDFITAITNIRDGGLAIYGGIIGAVIAAFIVTKIKKISLLPILDLAGPSFLIGQCIGRWANFVNQEAFGAPTAGNLPWGMTGNIIVDDPIVTAAQEKLTDGSYALVHPCFLYESVWCLIGFLLLHFYAKKLKSFDGEIALLYVVWYGAGRGFIEGLRTDSLYAGSLKISQVLGYASAVFALILFIYLKISIRKKPDYLMWKDRAENIQKIKDYEDSVALQRSKKTAVREMKRIEKESGEQAPSILGEENNEEAEKPSEKSDDDNS